MTLKEFLDEIDDTKSGLNKWIKDLENLLLKVDDKEQRQLVLRFGVIIAALIDHFDPKHKTVRRRDIYINKLSIKSKRMIRGNLLNNYLVFLNKRERYYQ